MSMTREDASRHLHNDWYIENGHLCVYESARDLFLEAVGMGIKALRPVSREQVEKVWRGEWVGVPNMGVYDTACSKCGYCPGIRFWDSDFCPNCGAPMTDEAVEMVVRRLEALHETV